MANEELTVCWLSGGVSSFIAAYQMREQLDRVIYIDIDDQHPDTKRFIKDCERALGIEVEILQSPYKTVESVIKAYQFINSRYGARCTETLKKRVRKAWEAEHKNFNLTYVWGFDGSERPRADRLIETMAKQTHIFPLIQEGMSKGTAHGILTRLRIERPAMYELGYQNNNCIGCVKGGMGYWNRIRIDFPEVFAARAKQEREIGHTCIKGIYLDELDPARGRFEDDIPKDCDIECQMRFSETEVSHDAG